MGFVFGRCFYRLWYLCFKIVPDIFAARWKDFRPDLYCFDGGFCFKQFTLLGTTYFIVSQRPGGSLARAEVAILMTMKR